MADNNPLGKKVDFPHCYSPEMLAPIARGDNRQALGIRSDEQAAGQGGLPFHGADIWNVYELSWLNPRGKPRVAMGRLIFPCDTPCLLESKSLKLYLGSFNQEAYASAEELAVVIQRDLSEAAGGQVDVALWSLDDGAEPLMPETPAGICLDDLDVAIDAYEPDPALLEQDGEFIVDEVLYSNLFRSQCPITGQPDWATVTICYRGRQIPRAALLRYLVSYRLHNDYHENCVERIYRDIQARCKPRALTVEANFLRRGGLDINPVRSSVAIPDYSGFPRYVRQ